MAVEPQVPSATTIHLVPHTHWDREWYEPFQIFRMRLVDLVDQVLDQLDADPGFRFTLDGQLATVDDYLWIRPEAEPRIRRLVEEGRLAIGPWQILMDEFLVSGETIVRNLELGRRRASELGGAMEIGYLPDMFGHIAQMPQILRRAGISHAVVWRGVPQQIDRHAFAWSSPDGSTVRAEYLVDGYGSGAFLFLIPDRAPARVAAFRHAMSAFYGDRSLLAMYGTDHALPAANLRELVNEVNQSSDEYAMRVATLPEYITAVADGWGTEAADPGGPERSRWNGELRSSARANLLMNVTSARIDLKAAAGRAERALERIAEPLHALYATEWPATLLAIAWRKLIDNSAHDSICGCSVDPVVSQVISRYDEAEQIGQGTAARVVRKLAAAVPIRGTVVVNPSPAARTSYVELVAPIPDDWPEVALELPDGRRVATQEVARNHPLLHRREMLGREISQYVRLRLHGRELFGRHLNGISTETVDGVPGLTLLVDDIDDPPWLDTEEIRTAIDVASMAAPDATWRVAILATPRRTIGAVLPVPALGWIGVRAVEGHGELASAVRATPRGLENDQISVEVATDGTLRLSAGEAAVGGVGRLVDGGERGDTYNYGPPPVDVVVDAPREVQVEHLAGGPVSGAIAVRRTYDWPVGLTSDLGSRDSETLRTEVVTRLELRAGEPFVRLHLAFENRSRDHRLRFHVPLPRRASVSAAEGQFAVVERGLEIEAGHGETAQPAFPARGWVDAGGVAVLLDHILEYELVDGGRELALTVLRSTGLISRNDHPYREDPAGPEYVVPDAQCLGPWEVGFAIYPHVGDWREARVPSQAEQYQHPFLTAAGANRNAGAPLLEHEGLRIEADDVVMSALHRRGDWLELRLVNLGHDHGEAALRGPFEEARAADILGQPGPELQVGDGRLNLTLGPAEIRTIQLR